jgi:hypothetical protein
MQWRAFKLPIVLIAVVGAFPPRIQPVQAAADGYPRAKPYLKILLEDAHKRFRKDAVITRIELQGAAGIAWLGVGLYSPSNGAILSVQVGGPNNGAYRQSRTAPGNVSAGLPTDFKVDLPDAVVALRGAGWSGGLGPMYLGMVGASGTPPILAWTLRVTGGPMMFPVFIDAQSGELIAWQRAMDPPNGSDAQLKAIWDKLLNRNQSKQPDLNAILRHADNCSATLAGYGGGGGGC